MPTQISDSNFQLCEYTPNRRGSHGVVGLAVFQEKYIQNMIRTGGGWRINYGYHSQGDRFLVHKADIQRNPNWFQPVAQTVGQRVLRLPSHAPPVETKAPVELGVEDIVGEEPENEPTSNFYDFQALPGVTPEMSDGLNELGAHSLEDLLELGQAITGVKGIGTVRAEAILETAKEKLAAVPEDLDEKLDELEKLLA